VNRLITKEEEREIAERIAERVRKFSEGKSFFKKEGVYLMRKLRIPKKTYRRKGKLIHRKSYLRKDIGKPGRTPISKRWLPKLPATGWEKDMPAEERRRLVLEANDYDYLKAAREMQALANVQTNKGVKAKMKADADYFFRIHRING